MNRKPLLLGHRGLRARGLDRLSSSFPMENSIAAFACALASGSDGFEFDVRRTRDGRNVLWHDSEWQGLEIAATDYAAMEDRNGIGLACLEDVLEQFGHRAWLDIELKVPGSEDSVVAALRANPPQQGFIVSSFLPNVLLRLHDLAPELRLGFICDRDEAIAVWREMPIRVLLPHYSLVGQAIIGEAHQSGLQIMTWTVNDSRKMRELAEWGIDGLISDDPQLLYQTFHSD